MFRHFADQEFRGSSPRYERLARLCADRPELAAPLLAARAEHRRATLFFAAVQYLLRTAVPEHPLAAYLPTLAGRRPAGRGLEQAFADLVAGYGDELRELCRTRTTQTNEARRAAQLRPGFGLAARQAAGRPLALVELGTSAGLLLLPDRYGYRYHLPDGRSERFGRADAPQPLVLDCEVTGEDWRDGVREELSIADRVGIDLTPLDPADPGAAAWLRSCVWPEHTDRIWRLDAALAEAAAVRPRLVPGDMVTVLPEVLSAVDPGTTPCVFSSNSLVYLSPDRRRRLVEVLTAVGSRRDLAVLLNEASSGGAELFLAGRPAEAGPPGVLAVGLLTLVSWPGGRASVEVLARTGPHGQWLAWRRQRYGFAPHTRSTP